MMYSVFAVYDSKAAAYLPPFILPRVEMAKRIFSDCVNSNDHQFSKHPGDYTLFCLGDWDDETAKHTPYLSGQQSLGNGLEYVIQDTLDAQMDLLPAKEGPTNGKNPRVQKIKHGTPVQSGAKSDNSSE